MFIVHLCLMGVVIKRMEWTFLARWWGWLQRDNSTLMKGPPAPVQNTSQCLFLGYEGRSADTVWRNNMSIEKRPLEDAVPIEHGAFPLPSSLPSLPESSHPLRSEPFLFPPSHINSLIFISIVGSFHGCILFTRVRDDPWIFPTYQTSVWPIYLVSPLPGQVIQFDYHFSNGLKPPTSHGCPTSAGSLPKKRHCLKDRTFTLVTSLTSVALGALTAWDAWAVVTWWEMLMSLGGLVW